MEEGEMAIYFLTGHHIPFNSFAFFPSQLNTSKIPIITDSKDS